MGKRGSKMTAAAGEVAATATERLQSLGDVTSKKMFGGFGLFESGTMFGIVDSKGALFFRADPDDVESIEAEGSIRHGKMPYWSVPPEVAADDERLLSRASRARDIAVAAKKK